MLSDYCDISDTANYVLDTICPETFVKSVDKVMLMNGSCDQLARQAFRESIPSVHEDARVLAKLANATKKLAEAMECGSKLFDPIEYGRKMMFNANKTVESLYSEQALSPFLSLSNDFGHLLRIAPVLYNYLGAIEVDPIVEARPKVPRKVYSKVPNGPKAAPRLVNSSAIADSVGQDETLAAVDKLYQQLVGLVEENGGQAILYIRLVCNRTSFGKTVENTFHSMFLMKEGNVRIFVDMVNGKKESLIEPIVPTVNGTGKNKQAILSLNMDRWADWCQKLDEIDAC